MKFYRDSDELVKVEWYFVPDDTPEVPYAHPFGTRVWDKRNQEGEPDLGERFTNRTYRKGKKPYRFKGVGLCGTREQWERGASVNDELPEKWPDSNVPRCCPKPQPDPFALLTCPDPCGCGCGC